MRARTTTFLLAAALLAGCSAGDESACEPTTADDCSAVFVGVSGVARFGGAFDPARAGAAMEAMGYSPTLVEEGAPGERVDSGVKEGIELSAFSAPDPGANVAWALVVRFDARPEGGMSREQAEARGAEEWDAARPRFEGILRDFEERYPATHVGDITWRSNVGIE